MYNNLQMGQQSGKFANLTIQLTNILQATTNKTIIDSY